MKCKDCKWFNKNSCYYLPPQSYAIEVDTRFREPHRAWEVHRPKIKDDDFCSKFEEKIDMEKWEKISKKLKTCRCGAFYDKGGECPFCGKENE